MLYDHDLSMQNNIGNENPLCGQLAWGRGRFRPKHPIIVPILSLPFYALFESQGLLQFNVIDTMILIILLFKLNRLFFNELISFFVAMIYATGTLFLNYVYNYSPDILSTVMVIGAIYFVFRERYYLSAVLLGLSIFAKVSNIVPAGILIAYVFIMIFKKDGSVSRGKGQLIADKVTTMIIFLLVFLVALTPLLYTNFRFFGSPFLTGYQRTAERGRGPGELQIFDHAAKFDQPFLQGAYRLLFLGKWGIIPTNPVLILGLLGVLLVRRKENRHRYYLLMLICVAQFIFFAKYSMGWGSTSHFSNRFLMTSIALSSVFTGNVIEFAVNRFFY
jgi:hypothetical protein